MAKVVEEDWTYFNRAAEKRIAEVYRSRGTQPPAVLLRPSPIGPTILPTQRARLWHSWWLRRLAALIAGLLLVWLLILFYEHLTAPTVEAVPAQEPAQGVASAETLPQAEPAKPSESFPTMPAEEQPLAVVTNYTTFQTVTFQHGSVVTGWNFDSNTDRVPSSQFCYFFAASGGASAAGNKFNIENRPGRKYTYEQVQTDELRLTLEEWRRAGTLCRWNTETAPAAAPAGARTPAAGQRT